MLGIGKHLAVEERNQQVAIERLHHIVAQAAFVQPGLAFFAALAVQADAHTRHQHRLAAQQVGELGHGQLRRLEIAGLRPGAHRGAAFAVTFGCDAGLQRLDHIALGEDQARHFALAVGGGLQSGGQRVGDADAHPVQAAGKAVGPAAAFVEFATRVQAGEHQLDHRGVFFGVQTEGNATAIVFHGHRVVGVQRDLDFFAVPGQRLVCGVVQHFLNDMQRVVSTGVHAGALFDRLQTPQDADGTFGIRRLGGLRRGGGRALHAGDCSQRRIESCMESQINERLYSPDE